MTSGVAMYAQNTTVSVEKSLEEIRTTLAKVGSVGFSFGNFDDKTFIAFTYQDMLIRMVFEVPSLPDKKCSNAQIKKIEQARRTRYRQILLCLKAKFEGILSGIETKEQAFMPYIVMAGKDEPAKHLGFGKDRSKVA